MIRIPQGLSSLREMNQWCRGAAPTFSSKAHNTSIPLLVNSHRFLNKVPSKRRADPTLCTIKYLNKK